MTQAANVLGTFMAWAYVIVAVILLVLLASTLNAIVKRKASPSKRLTALGSGFLAFSIIGAFTPSVLQAINFPVILQLPAGEVIPLPFDLYQGSEVIGAYASEGTRLGGANDHIDFIVRGPNGQTISSHFDRAQGNFKIDATMSGVYTVVVDNSGLLRSTGRSVIMSVSVIPWWAKGIGRWWYVGAILGVLMIIASIVLLKPEHGSEVPTDKNEVSKAAQS